MTGCHVRSPHKTKGFVFGDCQSKIVKTLGTVIRATIKSEVFTIEEKMKEMGWSKEVCEKMLQETGYSWENALVKYYFEGEIAELYEKKRRNTRR